MALSSYDRETEAVLLVALIEKVKERQRIHNEDLNASITEVLKSSGIRWSVVAGYRQNLADFFLKK